MKFIKLTKPEGENIYIQAIMIVAIYSISTKNPYEAQTRVSTMGGSYYEVMESVEEVQKLIKETEKLHTITLKTEQI